MMSKEKRDIFEYVDGLTGEVGHDQICSAIQKTKFILKSLQAREVEIIKGKKLK
jgi:hypothetical protein